MRSNEYTLFLSASSLGKLAARPGKSHSMLLIISQKQKSATVMYPKYQPSSLQFLSSSTNFGCIFSSQQNSGDCWGVLETLQLFRFIWQIIPMMLSFMSCLLLNMSNRILSRTLFPKRESCPDFRTMYQMMPCWPVTTKSPSFRKGRPLMTQFFAQFC